MKFSVTTLSLLSGALAFQHAVAQTGIADSLTVRDAVNVVLSRNPALKEASHVIEASNALLEQKRSGYLPTADIEASYVLLQPVAEFDLPGGPIKIYPANNYDGHIGVRQLIYDFQKTDAQVGVAVSRVALAEDSREMVKRDLEFRTAETFYAILFLRRSVAVQEDQIRTLNEHLLTAQKKIVSGTATQLDALTTQVRVAAAQTFKINLESSLHDREISLRRLAVLPADAPLNLKGEFTQQSVPLNGDSLLALASTARIEAKAAGDAIESAGLQQRVAHFNDSPSLSASLAYGLKNGFIPNIDVLRGNIVAGVELKVPIFDGGRTGNMEDEALANLHAAEARKQEVDLNIRAEVQQALSEVNAALARVQVSEINIRQADLAVGTARLRYDAGAVSNLDLLDAETGRAQANLTNLQALYDFVISSFRLRKAAGSPILEP